MEHQPDDLASDGSQPDVGHLHGDCVITSFFEMAVRRRAWRALRRGAAPNGRTHWSAIDP